MHDAARDASIVEVDAPAQRVAWAGSAGSRSIHEGKNPQIKALVLVPETWAGSSSVGRQLRVAEKALHAVEAAVLAG